MSAALSIVHGGALNLGVGRRIVGDDCHFFAYTVFLTLL